MDGEKLILDESRHPVIFDPPPGATQPVVVVYFTALYWALAS